VADGMARGWRGTNSIARRSTPGQAASVRGQSNQVLSAVLRAGRASTAGLSLLSTPDSILIRYGVLQHYLAEPSRLTARRAFFLIDREGRVRGKWLPEIQAALFPSDPILEKVREITGRP
jgi:peroxiredoxin